MANIIGYILAGLGLIGIIASSSKIHDSIPLIKSLPIKYMIIVSIILVVIGIILLVSKGSGKVKQISEEVPIYEGEGKKRKIVGYKKAR